MNDAILVGFKFFPRFENINETYSSYELFANIETRLHYLEILNHYGLEKNSTKFQILKATKGRLITDNYEFVSSFDSNLVEFDVAGTRHSSDINEILHMIHINDKLELELEPNNLYDKYAIKVIIYKSGKKYHLGYVPRYYSLELISLLKKNIKYSAIIESLNFDSEITDEAISASVRLIFDN